MAGNALTLTLIAMAANWFIIYRRQKLAGNILFMGLSGFLLYSANGNDTVIGIGVIFMLMAVLNFIFDMVEP